MTTNNSTTQYFKNVNCIEALKKQYSKLVKAFHPDLFQDSAKKANAEEEMKIINAEYAQLFEVYKNIYQRQDGETYTTPNPTDEIPEDFIRVMRQTISMNGVKTELCGRWIWCTGNTKQYKDELKELGFSWSPNKTAWYYRNWKDRCYSKGKSSLESIRKHYGSEELTPEPALA